MTLSTKTKTELCGIALSLGIPDVFAKTHAELVMDIQLASKVQQKPSEIPPAPVTDHRIGADMIKPEEMDALLEPLIKLGLKTSYDEYMWHFSLGKKQDSGTLCMPARTAYRCAQALFA